MVHLFMEASDMKQFILRIFVFFAIVALVDAVMGVALNYLQANKAGGRTGAEYYVCKDAVEDVIIMGSSRASHHYVPQIITDSLGLSCFNAGQDGNGIILQYGRWKMISERYTPKMIIYDVNPAFDLTVSDNMAYIDRLKPFGSDEPVRNYVAELFPMERLKLFSKMYKYNYKWIEIVHDCIRNKGDEMKGYIPLKGVMRQEMIERNAHLNKHKQLNFDKVKLHYLDLLIAECLEKGTKFVLVASPLYGHQQDVDDIFKPVNEIAKKYDVPFYNYYDSEYSQQAVLFKDSHHLNDDGAKAFTKEITSRIDI